MYFDERNEGDYRIYAGAIEAAAGPGFLAAVIVKRVHGKLSTVGAEAFRDERLSCGHRWAEANDALAFAISKGVQLIRSDSKELRC